MDVEDAGAAAVEEEVALEDARSRVLSAMLVADAIVDMADAGRPPPTATPTATSARIFDDALTVLEGRVAVGERGARCAAVALGLVSSLALVLDRVAADAPRPSLCERLPRLRAVLLDRLAPAPAADDNDLQEFVDDAARMAGSAAVEVCRALGSEAGQQLVHECVGVSAAAAAQQDAPLGARLRAASTLGDFAMSQRPATAPLVPQCLEALVALAGALRDSTGSPGAGKGDDEDEDDKDGGSDDDDDDGDEEDAANVLAGSRLCVLRMCRRLVDCAGGCYDGSGAPALSPELMAPALASVVAVAEAWSAGPIAFFDYVDEEEIDDDCEAEGEAVEAPLPSVVAAAVLALLAALARYMGPASLRPYAGLDTPWVASLLERAGRHKSKAVRRLAAATRNVLAA